MAVITGKAWKDGKFWLIEIEINNKIRLTQTENLQEVQVMADDLALCYGVENPQVKIEFLGSPSKPTSY